MRSDDVIELQFPRPPNYLQVKTRFALPSSPRTVNVWYLWSSLLSSSSDSSALALSLKPYLDSSLDISTWDFWDFVFKRSDRGNDGSSTEQRSPDLTSAQKRNWETFLEETWILYQSGRVAFWCVMSFLVLDTMLTQSGAKFAVMKLSIKSFNLCSLWFHKKKIK